MAFLWRSHLLASPRHAATGSAWIRYSERQPTRRGNVVLQAFIGATERARGHKGRSLCLAYSWLSNRTSVLPLLLVLNEVCGRGHVIQLMPNPLLSNHDSKPRQTDDTGARTRKTGRHQDEYSLQIQPHPALLWVESKQVRYIVFMC